MNKSLISIALCTYNGEEYLAEQLNSILRQDYQPIEIVIIDDCSTDQTYQLLEKYKQRHPHIKLYQNNKNVGFNKNFEKALSNCSGDFIAIADQDDIWEPEKLTAQMTAIKDNLLLYHDSSMIDEKGTSTGKKLSDGHRFVNGKCDQFLLFNNCVSGHTCLLKKELLREVFPIPENMYYDWWLAYTAASLGKINYIEPALVKHRRHISNATASDKMNSRAQRIRNLKLFKNHPLCTVKTKGLITELLNGYKDLEKQVFSRQLFTVLLKNSNTIFYIRKKSNFSKVKYILKECLGRL